MNCKEDLIYRFNSTQIACICVVLIRGVHKTIENVMDALNYFVVNDIFFKFDEILSISILEMDVL